MANDRIAIAKLRELNPDPLADVAPGAGFFPAPQIMQPTSMQITAVADELMQEVAAQVDSIAAHKAKAADIAAQRQRDEDAALADADEIVRRMRIRLGRRVCSPGDGRTIREIWEKLKAMPGSGSEHTSDNDESFKL